MRRVALITGGSRGIGLGVAMQLASQGFDIVINGVRSEKDVKEVLDDISLLGVNVIYCQGNIGVKEDRNAILQKIRDRFNRLDVLINNAGIAPKVRNDILNTSEESFDEVLSVNLKGNFFLTQSAANWMIAQKEADHQFEGCIINISSISATVASINRGEYCLSKAGVSMATQLFAVRLGEFNIPVFEIRPGIISTDMTVGVKEKYDKLLNEGLCVQSRWGQPSDVGKVVASLVSGNFGYSTGQVFMVDGGLTIHRL